MERLRRASARAAGAAVSFLALAAALASCVPSSAGSVALAVPRSDEREALAVAAAAGLSATAATTISVSLSDFSKIVELPASEALARARPGDPRRTPLLDELERRLSAIDATGRSWSLLYAEGPREARALALALERAGLSSIGPAAETLASRLREPPAPMPLLLVPASLWGLWLVLRRGRAGAGRPSRQSFTRTGLIRLGLRGRELGRRLASIACAAPLLIPSRLLPSALGVSSMTLFYYLDKERERGSPRRESIKAVWPLLSICGAFAAFAAAWDPAVLAYALAVAALRAVAPRLRSRLARRSSRHDPPAFRGLAIRGRRREVGVLAVGSLGPLFGIFALAWAFSSYPPPDQAGASQAGAEKAPPIASARRPLGRPSLVFGERLGAAASRRLLAEHLQYQRALTYGRLGEARLGEPGYTTALRYTEENGRFRISEASMGEGDGNGNGAGNGAVDKPGMLAEFSSAEALLGRRAVIGIREADR